MRTVKCNLDRVIGIFKYKDDLFIFSKPNIIRLLNAVNRLNRSPLIQSLTAMWTRFSIANFFIVFFSSYAISRRPFSDCIKRWVLPVLKTAYSRYQGQVVLYIFCIFIDVYYWWSFCWWYLIFFIFLVIPTFWSHFYLYLMCESLLMNLARSRFNDQPYSREGGQCTVSWAWIVQRQHQPPLQLRYDRHRRLRRPPQQRCRGQRGELHDWATHLGWERSERISLWRLSSTTG